MNDIAATHVPLWRRLAAGAYDALVVLALWMLAGAILVPLSGGAITSDRPWIRAGFQFSLLAVGYAFFGWFWTRDGQTLGMLAWRVRLVSSDGRGKVGWGQALIRYLGAYVSWAAAGLGFWWSLFDQGKRAWHDRLSGTELRMAPRFGAETPPPC